MNFLKKNKTAIGGGVVLLAGVYVYFTYFSDGAAAALTSSRPRTPPCRKICW